MNNIKNEITGNYTICPNTLLLDNNISRGARLLFLVMASKPDTWNFYHSALAKDIGCNEKTLRGYLDELKNTGWITASTRNNNDGSPAYTYTLHSLPVKITSGKNYRYSNKDLLSNKDIEREGEKISFNDVMKMYVDTFGPNLCLTPNQGKHRRYIDELIGRGFAKREFQKVITAKKQEYDAGKFDTYVILPNALFKPDNFENNLAIINNPRKEAARQNGKAAGKKVNDKFTKEATKKYKDGWI